MIINMIPYLCNEINCKSIGFTVFIKGKRERIVKEKLYFVLSMMIFGAVGVFAKYIGLSSGEIALFLSLIGSVFLLTIFKCKKQKIAWRAVKANAAALFAAGIALCGNWIFLFQAYKETTIANAALSYYFAPVLVIMLSPLVLREKWSLKKALCVGVALLGLLLILRSSTQDASGNHLLGMNNLKAQAEETILAELIYN